MAGIWGEVLLVTGDSDKVSVIGEALGQAGLDHEIAADIPAASRFAADRKFDAVLLGNDKNAVDAIAFLKSSGTKMPVLVMSDPSSGNMPVEAIKYVLSGALIQVDGLHGTGRSAIATLLELASRSRESSLGARLQEEIDKLSYFADNLPECLLMIDRAGTVVYANRAFHDRYEYRRGDLIGFDFSRMLAGPEDTDRIKNIIRTIRPGGSNLELAMVTRRGRNLLSLAIITPRSDDTGTVLAYVLLLQDITNSRYSETRLQRRLSALTSPAAGLSSFDFKELVQDPEIQELQDTLAAALGVSAIIVAGDGIPLNRGSNVMPLCASLAQAGSTPGSRCRKCIADLVRRAATSQGARCTCQFTGMAEAAIPMAINGEPAAFWVVGQVSLDEPDRVKLHDLLIGAGIPPGEINSIIAGTPRMTEYQLNQIVATFNMVADKVTRLAVQNLQQGKYINERNLALEELRRSEQRLQEMSYRDGLSGLHNRAFFERELGRIETEATANCVSFVAVDVDGLKMINDTLGHSAGDQYIRLTAHMLDNVFSGPGVVCRIGGDEFGVLLPGCDEPAAGKLIDLLREEIRQHNEREPGTHVSMSVGTATTTPGESLYDAYKRADRMMYEHKMKRDDYARSKSIDMILLTLSERDYMDHGHTQMLTTIVDAMAIALGLKEEVQANLKLLARLHDLGKIGVPDEIVMKPGKLTDPEWVLMRSHVEIGANIASRSFHMNPIAPLIRHHHERYDGTGYPSGLAGSEIPLECRIMAIADSYDAMIADRPYRKGLEREYALGEILQNSGTQFDPELVEIFAGLVKAGRI